MKNKFFKIFTSTVLLILLTSNLCSFAWTVNPVRFEVKAERGKEYTLSFTVLNESQISQKRLKIFIDDWGLDNRNNFIIKSFAMDSYDKSYSAADWVKVTPAQLVLPPGATRKVRFTLTIPADLPADGEHTLGIFVKEESIEKPPKGLRTVLIKQNSIIAVVVYVSIGQEKLNVSLDNLTVESNKSSEKGLSQVVILPHLHNAGNNHTRGKISLMLTPSESAANEKLKDKIKEVERDIVIEDVVILRESKVEYPITLPQYLPVGSDWLVELKSDFGKKLPLISAKKRFTVIDPYAANAPSPSPAAKTPDVKPSPSPAAKKT
jgi:hypothetical protein